MNKIFIIPAAVFALVVGSWRADAASPSEQQKISAEHANWTVSMGAVFLTRDRGDDTKLLRTFLSLAAPTIFSADDFDHEYETGYTIDLTRHIGAFDLHVNYFDVDGMDASAGFTAFPASAITVPGGLLPSGGQSLFEFSSEITSAEINIKAHTGTIFKPFAGFRWLQLNEDLLLSSRFSSAVLAPNARIETENNLYGIQLGTDIQILNTPRFGLMATGKFTIAKNRSSNSINTLGPLPAAGLTPSFGTSKTTTATILDLGLQGKIKFNNNIALTAGYSALLLSNIALAPAQIESNSSANGGVAFGVPTSPIGSRKVVHDDDLLLHGVKIALEVTW